MWEQFLQADLDAAEIDPDELISQSAALCIADAYGVYEEELGRGAILSVVDRQARWTVKTWQWTSCEEFQDGSIGDMFGCGLVLDALSGEADFAAAVRASMSCGS